MIRLVSLVIWASFSIGGASAGCFSDFAWPGLKGEPASGGWNGVGKGFLNMFTPDKLSDDQWKNIGNLKKKVESDDIKELTMSMGGLVFLMVVSVLLILLFCAAPCALCVYSSTCKKKCKPKSNAIVTYVGIACNSLAILTISLGILFCFLSIGSLTSGIGSLATAFDPLPSVVDSIAAKAKDQAKCSAKTLVGSLKTSIDGFPSTISSQVSEIPEIKAVLAIDFEAKKAKIEEFKSDAQGFIAKLTEIEGPVKLAGLTTIVAAVGTTKIKINDVYAELSRPDDDSITKRLDKVASQQKEASRSEIESKIKTETRELSDKITKVSTEVEQQIDKGFNEVEKLKNKIKSFVDEKIKKNVEKVKEHVGIMTALNLVLFPCYLALASAIWATCQTIKFVQKKKAKPKEKGGLLIPIAIGLGLTFIPLLASTSFMMVAGVSNVVCNTVFHDKSMGFVPQAINAFELKPRLEISGIKVEILTALQECQAGKPLISVLKQEDKIEKDMITKKFDIDKKKEEFTKTITDMSFGLPKDDDWNKITGEIDKIVDKRKKANDEITLLETAIQNEQTILAQFDAINEGLTGLVKSIKEFIEKIDKFVKTSNEDIDAGKKLKEAELKTTMKNIMVGEGEKPGLLKEMMDKINGEFLAVRTEALTTSTSCAFAFAAFEDIGVIVCGAFSGTNGIYSAIGLAVFSFFSACVGTVLIWHTLRVGKGQDQKKPGDEKSSDVNSKNKKKKKGGKSGDEEGDEEEEAVAPEKMDMTGKVGEQAEPMKQPTSQPTPPGGALQPPPGVPVTVQAVPTDPAAPGEKTNPSLLPNDEKLAGGGAPPASAPDSNPPVSPIQMVNMEMNNQNSITGAGGETAGGGPGGATQQ